MRRECSIGFAPLSALPGAITLEPDEGLAARFLVDPLEREPLSFAGDCLVARNGANYPIVDGIPVLLRVDLPPTHRGAARTVKLADMARQACPSTWSPPSTFARN